MEANAPVILYRTPKVTTGCCAQNAQAAIMTTRHARMERAYFMVSSDSSWALRQWYRYGDRYPFAIEEVASNVQGLTNFLSYDLRNTTSLRGSALPR